jgi:hypothetical protein
VAASGMETFNYFNYFTEIEEHFWKKRGAHLLVSPLDWAIVETWQKAGIPLDAVLRGIDSAFESHLKSRRSGGRPLKSLAYCVDAVLDAALQQAEAAAGTGPDAGRPAKQQEPFSRKELREYLARNGERLARASQRLSNPDASEADGAKNLDAHFIEDLARRVEQAREGVAAIISELDGEASLDFEDIERRLTILEDRLTAALSAAATEEMLLTMRRDLDRQLTPYRRKMSAEQLAQLERQYTQKRLFENFDLPRLSLFYLT